MKLALVLYSYDPPTPRAENTFRTTYKIVGDSSQNLTKSPGGLALLIEQLAPALVDDAQADVALGFLKRRSRWCLREGRAGRRSCRKVGSLGEE